METVEELKDLTAQERISVVIERLKNIEFVRYEKVESVLSLLWDCPVSELASTTLGGATGSGEEVEISYSEMIAGISEEGCYGFVSTDLNQFHFWVDDSCDIYTAMHFFGHELAHVALPYLAGCCGNSSCHSIGTSDQEVENTKLMNEEVNCELFGIVAAASYDFYEQCIQQHKDVKDISLEA